MIKERVSVISGDAGVCPIVFVAPHGADDPLSGLLAETIATLTNGFAVINNGFERASDYDYDKDLCNCNNIEHLQNDVPKAEFLDPLMEFMDVISMNSYTFPTMLILHGVSNSVNIHREKPKIEVIAGYGSGDPPSFSCERGCRYALLYCLSEAFEVFKGDKGSPFAGRRRKNLNQLYRKWYPRTGYNSVQLEIVRELRKDESTTKLTAEMMSKCIAPFVEYLFLRAIEPEDVACPNSFKKDWMDIAKGLPKI